MKLNIVAVNSHETMITFSEVGNELLGLAVDSNSHDDLNQEDENTLNELEWELASRTGNIKNIPILCMIL